MRRKIPGKLVIFLMIGVCLFLLLSIEIYAKDTRKTRVLVLNSYHKGIPWVYDNIVGIESRLDSIGIDYDLRLEYMDTKNVKYDAAYKQLLYNMYLHKYANYRFDIIISTDDNALNFLCEYHKELFPDTPIVFGGVNNKEAPNLIDKNCFTGILELTDEKGMIDFVRSVHPQTKKIFYVADTSHTGTSVWNRVESLSSRYPDIQFFRIDDRLSLSEIEDKVKKLSDDSVILYTVMFRDKTGPVPFEESISRIAKASSRPVYTFFSHNIKYGAIGGKVLDGKHHGGGVAEIVIRILQGEKVSNIPVVDWPTGQYIFNYAQLKRFGINLSALPEESIILNRPFSFYREYKYRVWITLIFVFILIVIIIVLQINVIKRKRAEKELRKYHGQLEEMVKERTAELLIAKEQADTANRAKSEFLANMSHEIRTPMNTVLGFAEILKGKEGDSQKRHYIESIQSGGNALLSLVNDILDLSKIEARKIVLQYSALSIQGLFQEMKTIFDRKIVDKGIEFIVESSEDLPEALILDDVEVAAAHSLKEREEIALEFSTIVFEPATVLVVDDIDYNREMLDTYLDGWDLNIIFATNGREAIDQASKHHPNLILLDMKMPVMDGYEASEVMKKDQKLKNIPVIAVTASAMKQSEEIISRICDGYLRKPVSRTDLVRELMKHLPYTIKEIKEETPSKAAPSTELILPPPEQIKKLLKAANMGSITDMKESISEIRQMDLKYHPFADRIDVLTRKYQFEEIIDLLEKNTKET